MYLKKNDKIILLVGIVIIVIAGVGIAMYNVEDTDNSNIGEDSGYDTFSYTWVNMEKNEKIYTDEFVNKGELFEDTFNIKSPDNTVLTKVEFTLSWIDDVTYRGLLSKGYDTLDLELLYGSESKGEAYVYEGNEMNKSFMFNIYNMPTDDTVKAESQSAAEEIVNKMIADEDSATFDITVSVQTGEKFYRFLKWLKDKGNDFDLTATYTYYTYDLQMEDNNNDNGDMKDTGDGSFNHNIGEFYRNLGYGRGMI
jgi:hypothetical protein